MSDTSDTAATEPSSQDGSSPVTTENEPSSHEKISPVTMEIESSSQKGIAPVTTENESSSQKGISHVTMEIESCSQKGSITASSSANENEMPSQSSKGEKFLRDSVEVRKYRLFLNG